MPHEPTIDCTIMAGRLAVRHYRHLPMLLRWSWRVRRQFRATPGLVDHAIHVDGPAKTLWIVSVWTSRTALSLFDRAAVHEGAKAVLRPTLTPSTFVVWGSPRPDRPIWDEVRSRIAAADRRRAEPGDFTGASR